MLKVGLTGGIGSGKTTVSKIFRVLGIPVYYADEAARRLMNSDPELRYELIRHFGPRVFHHNELDRKYLASVVFSDREKLELLNSLTHPATLRDAAAWLNRQSAPYVIKEAALLFESGATRDLDVVVGVYAPQPLRVQRVMERDGASAEEVMKRIGRQLDEEMKMKLCDHVIRNNEQELLIPQVLELHRLFSTGKRK